MQRMTELSKANLLKEGKDPEKIWVTGNTAIDALDFHNYMHHSYLILTDSGGIQEEAPSLGKPVLVMRDTLKLVGTSEKVIYNEFTKLLDSREEYEKMSHAANPYGDGHACERIADVLEYGEVKAIKIRMGCRI